jgi:hypothetical protein
MMNIEVPQLNILLDISTITQLNRDSAAYANMQPATPDRLVKAVSTRVIFLPSFLLADLSNIGRLKSVTYSFKLSNLSTAGLTPSTLRI